MQGAVTSPHTEASEAGLAILRQGGNAVEASIAIAAKLSVTYPHFNGLGGDAFMLLSNAKGEVISLSGIGQAFEKLPNFGASIPTRGINSAITTAATVDTWGKAYEYACEKWGQKISWKDLFTPAIETAELGFSVSKSQQFWYEFRQHEMESWSGFKSIFSKNNQLYQEGMLFKQPQLAKTLKLIAQHGHREFYEGKLAKEIVIGLQRHGSTIQLSDLEKTHARLEEPLKVAYRDGELYSLRPPTQGITTLEIMGILNCFDLTKLVKEGSADFYHYIIEAIKYAFLDRNRLIADPDFSHKDMFQILQNDYLKKQANKINSKKALAWDKNFQHGDTAYIGVTDQYGNCVSMLQTIYYDWGSGVVAGDTGILWHNRGASFQTEPAHHNVIMPFKRPFHTLNPGMYLQNNKPTLLFGTQGADGQPQTLATVLTRLIDFKLPPYEALERPRFLLGKTFSDQNESLKIESNVGDDVIQDLLKMQHSVEKIATRSPLAGHCGVIQITDKGILAAHDPRSDGIALGL